MVWVIELLVLFLIFTLSVVPTCIKNPLSMVHDYPADIYQKAIEMGLVKESQNRKSKKFLIKRIFAIVVIGIIFGLIVHFINGADDFITGAGYTYILWTAANWFDAIVTVCAIVIILFERQLKIIELGDQSATALGVRIKLIRGLMSVFGVLMLAFSIAVTGPIASVAFLAGPISARITGKGNANAGAAALAGILLILGSDLVGQFALGTRFPVGVVAGLLGAPYLLYLLITMNKKQAFKGKYL